MVLDTDDEEEDGAEDEGEGEGEGEDEGPNSPGAAVSPETLELERRRQRYFQIAPGATGSMDAADQAQYFGRKTKPIQLNVQIAFLTPLVNLTVTIHIHYRMGDLIRLLLYMLQDRAEPSCERVECRQGRGPSPPHTFVAAPGRSSGSNHSSSPSAARPQHVFLPPNYYAIQLEEFHPPRKERFRFDACFSCIDAKYHRISPKHLFHLIQVVSPQEFEASPVSWGRDAAAAAGSPVYTDFPHLLLTEYWTVHAQLDSKDYDSAWMVVAGLRVRVYKESFEHRVPSQKPLYDTTLTSSTTIEKNLDGSAFTLKVAGQKDLVVTGSDIHQLQTKLTGLLGYLTN